jgi:hypothetical protein
MDLVMDFIDDGVVVFVSGSIVRILRGPLPGAIGLVDVPADEFLTQCRGELGDLGAGSACGSLGKGKERTSSLVLMSKPVVV